MELQTGVGKTIQVETTEVEGDAVESQIVSKAGLVERIFALTTGVTKREIDKMLTSTLIAIGDIIEERKKLQLTGFGSFEGKYRPERKGRNPQTGAEILIKADNNPVFKAGKGLKDRANGRK